MDEWLVKHRPDRIFMSLEDVKEPHDEREAGGGRR